MITCANCMYMTLAEQTISPTGEILEASGYCHRYPAVRVPDTGNANYENNFETHYWIQPTVNILEDFEDWCGDHKFGSINRRIK